MKKFLLAIPALALFLTACGSTGYAEDDYDDYEDDYVAICVDPETDERLPDSACEGGYDEDATNDNFLLGAVIGYVLASNYPGVGHHVYDYRTTKPHGAHIVKSTTKGHKVKVNHPPKSKSGGSKSSGGGSKPKSSGGGFKSGGGGGFKSSGGRR